MLDVISFAQKLLAGEQLLQAILSSPPSSKSCGERLSSMTHKRGLRRSSKSYELRQQWHDAQGFVSGEAFRDRLISETVCLTTIDKVVQHLAATFEQAAPEAVPEVEPGLVLHDPLGQGAFQTLQAFGGISTGTK